MAPWPIAEAWKTVAAHMLPEGLPADQRLEARRLFFAGAYSLAQLQLAASNSLSGAHHQEFNDTLRAELALFAQTMGTPIEGVL